jgi:hypothetical protein
MKELFEKQLNGTQPLTMDVLEKLQVKTYFNGEEKQIGEVVLMAWLMGDVIEKEGDYPELPLKIISLNERHFDLFEYDEIFNRANELPTIKLKSSIDNGTDRILNLFGVSVNEVEFCNCGNPSGGHHCYVDENIIECADCGKQLQN